MILIVDDNPENIYSLKKVLELNNFKVDTAFSGEEALKKILKNSYILIILDVQMPGMDGFEVAETISGYSKTKDVPIIFLSAVNTDKRFITKGYASGGIDYITKPVDADILLLKVKTFYRLYEQAAELNATQAVLREEIEFRKAAEKKKDEFISIASHELKTPLTSIKGYIQILERSLKKYNEEGISNYLNRTHVQLSKLNNLVADLLDISKIESGKIQYNTEWFDFGQMVKNAIEIIEQTQECSIILKSFVENIRFYGDENRIEQVIINYLTNALKYSPDCNEVHVNFYLTGRDEIYLGVRDFGIGVPSELQEHVFDKFYRVEETSTRFQGLGMGLYISSEIIKRHKGEFGVISDSCDGSEFYFKLPLDPHPQQPEK
ncbi:hybrid sensor histidine kinase/response regulator [Flavihumibacter sp. R14]|nr:hybrid sensor histidine kinase/response regulator [Flavihumibacter soli]